ncbi:hypothetical protein BN946_scf184781.g11 [Trametes cinnabarina]|uniref:Uncharacterized protein n=1 Tax=Pycnoporus cinnabarinus TaxID=5643 RepID=A0A060SW46_PYCCI|nr:hypothetical protein BN946_scf184781.g11 [Trametes cinnabarina]
MPGPHLPLAPSGHPSTSPSAPIPSPERSSFLLDLPPDDVLDVLHLAAARGELKDLHERILASFINRAANATSLYRLAFTLADLGYNFTPAFRALQATYRNHCDRCHQWYDERQNWPDACVVQHGPPDIRAYPGYPGDPNVYWGRFYPCCGLNEVFPTDGTPVWRIRPCYVGPHLPASGPLEVSLRIGTCNDLGCYRAFEEMQRAAMPAPTRCIVATRPAAEGGTPRSPGGRGHPVAVPVQPEVVLNNPVFAGARSSTPPDTHG